jgi:hypothetical protein
MPIRSKSRFAVVALATLLSVGGCTPPTLNPRGVDYYKAHADEAKTVAAECAAGTITGPNCDAAAQAIASAKADATFNEALKTSKRKNEIGRHW